MRLERASLQFSLFVHTLAVILYAVVRRAEVVKLRGLDGLELASFPSLYPCPREVVSSDCHRRWITTTEEPSCWR